MDRELTPETLKTFVAWMEKSGRAAHCAAQAARLLMKGVSPADAATLTGWSSESDPPKLVMMRGLLCWYDAMIKDEAFERRVVRELDALTVGSEP